MGRRWSKDLILSPESQQKRRSRARSLDGTKATYGKEDEIVQDTSVIYQFDYGAENHWREADSMYSSS